MCDNVKKCVFLDIDGVLNSVQDAFINKQTAYDYEGLSRMGVMMIRKLCQITNSQIVLSSTWRYDGMEMVKGAFAVCGWRDIKYHHTIIDQTPFESKEEHKGNGRGGEIQSWLDDHPECTNYVIIDDDSDMMEHQMEHFVQTDSIIGFTMYDMAKAMNILGVSPGKDDEFFHINETIDWKLNKRKGDHGYTI